MKVNKILLIVALVALGLMFYMGHSCGSKAGQSVKEAEYGALKEQTTEHIKHLEAAIEEKRGEIERMEAEKNGAIDSSNTIIEKKQEKIEDLDKKIARIQKERDGLKSWEEIAGNEKREKDAWIEKFTLAQAQIEEKDKIIFSLNEKYDARVRLDEEIIAGFEEMARKEKGLRLAAEEMAADYRARLRRKDMQAKITTGLALIGAGFIAYQQVVK